MHVQIGPMACVMTELCHLGVQSWSNDRQIAGCHKMTSLLASECDRGVTRKAGARQSDLCLLPIFISKCAFFIISDNSRKSLKYYING